MPGVEGATTLEAALDELYGADPDEFVATRKRLAGELRAAGEKDAVKEIQAARRPTTAAWALNQLSREEPDLVEELLDRSAELRSAQMGKGGRDAMRDATRAQRTALADAVDAALSQLGDRATDAYRSQMLATLHAASADQQVGEQLRTGRLIREVSGSTGFPEGPMLTLVPDLDTEPTPAPATRRPKVTPGRRPPPTKDPKDTKAPKPAKDSDAAGSQTQAKLAAQRRSERERERERAAIVQAKRRVDEAEAAAQAAQDDATAAEAAAVEAREQVAALTHDLDVARREARTTDQRAVQARREATRLEKAAARLRTRSPKTQKAPDH